MTNLGYLGYLAYIKVEHHLEYLWVPHPWSDCKVQPEPNLERHQAAAAHDLARAILQGGAWTMSASSYVKIDTFYFK